MLRMLRGSLSAVALLAPVAAVTGAQGCSSEPDIENLCTCREARESGIICAHAVGSAPGVAGRVAQLNGVGSAVNCSPGIISTLTVPELTAFTRTSNVTS